MDLLRRTLGLTVVMVMHDLAPAARCAERLSSWKLGGWPRAGLFDRVLVAPEYPRPPELLACVGCHVFAVPEQW